jgi:GNAT superfamily N-acetyltransferase
VTPPEPSIRRATLDDAQACHDVMWTSITDFGLRKGTPLSGTAADWWAGGERLQRFLAGHAAEWWVAEQPDSGELAGYARSIERAGLFELTEFFVLPTNQSRGVGRALLERAFPIARGDIRSIIATTDVRALSRYYGAGTVARFPILTLIGTPTTSQPDGDMTPRPLNIESADLQQLQEIEASILEYGRGEDEIRWLLEDREGYLYERAGKPVGFAFVGKTGGGPIAALDPADLPNMLLHIEGRASALGIESLDLQVPAPNEIATRHLLTRGFRIDPWVNLLMSNRPFGRFDRYVSFGPPVFL